MSLNGTFVAAGGVFVVVLAATLGGMTLMDRHAEARPAVPPPPAKAVAATAAADEPIDLQASEERFFKAMAKYGKGVTPEERRKFHDDMMKEEAVMRVAHAHGNQGRVLCAKTIKGPSQYMIFPSGLQIQPEANVSQPVWEKAGCADAMTADSPVMGQSGVTLLALEETPVFKNPSLASLVALEAASNARR